MEENMHKKYDELEDKPLSPIPLSYVDTGMFRPKAYRKATKIQALRAEIIALKGLAKLEKDQVARLVELNKKMIEKLGGLGIKVVFKGDEIQFEAAR